MTQLFTKSRVAVWLLVALVIPWQLGGKEPLAILVDVVLMALAAFLLLRSTDQEPVGFGKAGWLPLAFLAWGGLSLVWSFNRYQTVVWLEVVGLAVGMFILASSFGRYAQLRRDWLNGYIIIATLTSLWGMAIYLTQSYNRLTSSFYLANPMAAYVLPAFLLATWQFVTTAKRWSGLCAAILGGTLVLADSRSAFLVLGLAIIIGLTARIKLAQWLRVGVVVIVTTVVVVGLNLTRGQLFHQATVVQGARFAEAAKGESTSGSDRLNYLGSTITIWQHYPVLGSGAGSFGTLHPQYQIRVISASDHAHNFYAQTLSELGLVGALILLAILVGVGWLVLVAFATRQGRVLAVIMALMVIHLALDIDSLYPSIMVVLGALAGLAVAARPRLFVRPRWWPVPLVLVLALAAVVPAAGAYRSDHEATVAAASQSNGDYQQAADDYAAAGGLTFNPDILSAEGINYYTLAGLERDRAKAAAEDARALELADKAEELDPLDAQHWFLAARVLNREHQFKAAEAAYQHTIALDPYNHPDYYVDLSYFYLLNNRPTEAVATATKILVQYPASVVANRSIDPSITPNLSTLYYFRALVERGTEPAKAKVDLEAALKLEPDNQSAKQLLQQLAQG